MINTISGIKIQKFSPNLGAIITDVDLSKGVNDDQFKDIETAFLEYQVLFFQNQNEISPDLHLKFGKDLKVQTSLLAGLNEFGFINKL